MDLPDAFRRLRAHWFGRHIHNRGDSWETDGGQLLRMRRNLEVREKFDRQTESLINGGGRDCWIVPTCADDMLETD